MKKPTVITLICLVFLLFGLCIGSPIEIITQPGNRILLITSALCTITLLFIGFRQAAKIQNKVLKITAIILLAILTLGHISDSIFVLPRILTSSYYPEWKDQTIYLKDNGIKIEEHLIIQCRETSGSIYDYRTKKIYKDFGNGIRISLYYPNYKINGVYTIIDIESGIEKTRTLVNGDY
ncbi:MAG TPA: hypothetical protein VN698_10115 [Bacteroidia bacterium]|nr:hypothetical protein [Bacteroidia bacterium]